jgi:hypothetical protein
MAAGLQPLTMGSRIYRGNHQIFDEHSSLCIHRISDTMLLNTSVDGSPNPLASSAAALRRPITSRCQAISHHHPDHGSSEA